MVIMLQKYEAVLKLNVRPNLDVILQIGVIDSNQEGLDYFRFYLESLELMLKDFNVWLWLILYVSYLVVVFLWFFFVYGCIL